MNPPEVQAILKRTEINPDSGCWEWQGAVTRDGYGQLSRSWTDARGLSSLAHRALYELMFGPVPDGRELDHICHNSTDCNLHLECPHRRCVNPDHLEPVTHKTNMLRGNGVASTNVKKTHCPQGHAYTIENTYIYDGPGNRRRCCRACNRAAKRRAAAS